MDEVAGGDRELYGGGCVAGRGGTPVGLDVRGLAFGEREGAGDLASRVFAGGGCGCGCWGAWSWRAAAVAGVARPGAVELVGGVPVGVQDTPGGALAAVDNYLALASQSVEQDPAVFATLVAQVYALGIRAWLTEMRSDGDPDAPVFPSRGYTRSTTTTSTNGCCAPRCARPGSPSRSARASGIYQGVGFHAFRKACGVAAVRARQDAQAGAGMAPALTALDHDGCLHPAGGRWSRRRRRLGRHHARLGQQWGNSGATQQPDAAANSTPAAAAETVQ